MENEAQADIEPDMASNVGQILVQIEYGTPKLKEGEAYQPPVVQSVGKMWEKQAK